jgi:lipopolysaccharide transport system ATP-binding protein
MSDYAIVAENVAKRYKIGQQQGYKTLRESLSSAVRAPFSGQSKASVADGDDTPGFFWALKDVSFGVKAGEVLGIVGHNGAGKSTLLKILSRITDMSAGSIDIRGRVGSLLEVGTGFHPELSGRENIFLNGAILGMKKHEISRKFDEIVAFAEVEKFLDTPVKRYSSGMYMRLAFAVAANLEPEILIVDEVLAVGDAAFQRKCLGKMEDVSKQGRTVLFVSHNMPAVKTLCQKAILLKAGHVIREGTANEIVDFYLEGGAGLGSERVWDDAASAPGSPKAHLRAVRIVNAGGELAGQVTITQPLMLEIEYEVTQPEAVLNLSVSIYAQDDVYVLASPSITDGAWSSKPHAPGHYKGRCVLPGNFFNEGRYNFSVLLVENGTQVIAQAERVVSVDMIDTGETRGGYFGYWGGAVRPTLDWQIKRLETA